MHRPLKFAALVAVAFAFTACADSARHPITGPDGSSLAKGTVTPLSPSLQALHAAIAAKTTELYSCATGKLPDNAAKDVAKLLTYAQYGWWTDELSGGSDIENVAYIAAKMIANNDANLAAGKVCNDAELVEDLNFLINVFANQGDYQGSEGEGASFNCPTTGCDEQTTGPNGFGVTVPPGTFPNGVFIVVRPYTPAIENSVGNKFDFSVIGGEANGPWTRWICWDGYVGETDVSPNPDNVVMVRIADEGTAEEFYDLLPTEWNDTRCVQQAASLNPILKGAHKLFAGLPFFPSTAEAYLPPRTFGGTGTAASPHFLTVTPDVDPIPDKTLQELYDLTDEYYGDTNPNKTAALGKVTQAINCGEDVECVNSALDSYIKNVTAQAGKQGVTTEEAEELIGIALGLMQ